MKILQKPNATVGQFVKDLELTVPKRPYLLLGDSDCDDYSSERYVKGVKLQKDIAILETTSKRDQAATAMQLLSAFRTMDASTRVVLQNGWRLLDIEPVNSLFKRFGVPKEEKEGDTIFWCTENTSYSLLNSGRDVRLLTTQQLETEVKKIDEEGFLDYAVVPTLSHGNGLRVYRANCLRMCYGKLCLCYDKGEEKDNITVGELLEGFPACAEFMVKISGRYYTVENDTDFCSIAKLSSKSLFTIHVGEMVFDPNEILE